MKNLYVVIATALFIAHAASTAKAQWDTQAVTFQPGWNAVYLMVQPEPNRPEDVFVGVPIKSVWMWSQRFSNVQFIVDPNELIPKQPGWLSYFPSDSQHPSVNNLHAIHGGRAYLVELSGDEPVELQVKGKPVVRPIDWIADSVNLVGFHVDTVSPPTFDSFLASVSSAHAGQAIYTLDRDGRWQQLSNPGTRTIERGRAYGVFCRGASDFNGPIRVGLERSDGIHFGRALTEQTVRIQNITGEDRTVTLNATPSQTTPGGIDTPLLAGAVPLSYWAQDVVDGKLSVEWRHLSNPLSRTLASGEQWAVRLAVRRADMEPFEPTGDGGEPLYQSLLEISDTLGTRRVVPVTSRGFSQSVNQPVPIPSRLTAGAALQARPDRSGLWVGSVAIRAVSQPSHETDPDIPRPASTEAQFRLIIHVDSEGKASLLQQVLLMWKDGTRDGDGVVVEPGREVLVTDDSLTDNFSGAALRDGLPVARRISSVAFGFKDPIEMIGAFGLDGDVLTGEVITGYNDPLSPFLHRYHPDHDNLNRRFDTDSPLPEGEESFTIRRAISLHFQEQDPEGLVLSGAGDRQVGGVYRETIHGVHKDPIYVEGIFRMHHASRVARLNSGL